MTSPPRAAACPRTLHLLSPVTGVPRLAVAPGHAPAPWARVAGATAGPQWAMTSPLGAGKAPGVRAPCAHHRLALLDLPDAHGWPSLSGQTSAPSAPPRAGGGASASSGDRSIRIAAFS